jgi:hypothetical protein
MAMATSKGAGPKSKSAAKKPVAATKKRQRKSGELKAAAGVEKKALAAGAGAARGRSAAVPAAKGKAIVRKHKVPAVPVHPRSDLPVAARRG